MVDLVGLWCAEMRTVRAASENSIRRPSLVDAMAALAAFLQMTELYRPLAYVSGLPSSKLANAAFGVAFAMYLAIRQHTVRRLLRSMTAFVWMLVLLPLPAVIMTLQTLDGMIGPERLLYWIAFATIYLELLFVMAVLCMRCGTRFVMPFFVGCIVATWCGFIVNATNYSFIREVLVFTSNRIAVSESTLRMMGFYPHPNSAAFAICIFLACAASDARFATQRVFFKAPLIVASIVGVLATGSRTSLLLMLCVIAFIALTPVEGKKSVSGRVLVAAGSAAAVLLIAIVAVEGAIMVNSDLASFVLARLESLGDLATGEIVARDDSASYRLHALRHYVADIASRPLLGYGPDYAFQQIASGYFANVSQNSWIEWALKFGVFYPLAVLIVFCITYRRARRISAVNHVLWRQAMLLLILLFLGMLSIVDIFWLRCTVGAMGVLLGQMALQTVVTRHGGTFAAVPAGSRDPW